MRNKREKAMKPIMTMASVNLDSWLHSSRTVIMLICAVLLCLLEAGKTLETYRNMDIILNLGETIYVLFSYGVNIFMSSVIFFVMISEIPRRVCFQNYTLIRSTRKKWLSAQILYCVFMVLLTLALLGVCILIFSSWSTVASLDWSDNARIDSGAYLASQGVVPEYVRSKFNIFSGTLYAAMPLFFFWFTLSMIILLFGIFGAPTVGILVCAFLLLAHFIGSFSLNFRYPIQYAMVQALDPDTYGPSLYRNTIIAYIGINAILILIMYIKISHFDLLFDSEVKA